MTQRQQLADLTSKINSLFGLQEQGRELVAAAAKASDCKHIALLFLDADARDFFILSYLPRSKANPFRSLRLSHRIPIVDYLRREKKPLAREGLASLSDFESLRQSRTGEDDLTKTELLVPLISRNRLIGVLVLGEKRSGRYSLSDRNFLQSLTDQAAVSMEKEYLRERLSQQNKELSVINRCSAIMASSLDIQEIFDTFIEELRKIVKVDWAAISLIGDGDLCFLAISSEIGSGWKVGERIPISGTATEWAARHKKVIVESDLLEKSRFVTAKSHIKRGVRSIAYLPLIANGVAIGSLILASHQPNSYSRGQTILLEELASQITTPIGHSQLYAEVVEKVRIDELTGLFNRRSFDEVLASEISRYSRYGGVFSLILLDLDSFKTVNDRYGHLAGDEALRQIGGIIRQGIRTSDEAFRYGGEEFTILLPNTSIGAAYRVAERVRLRIASEKLAGQTSVTASLGLATWPAQGREANEIIAAADGALYQAKQNGGNQSQRAGNA